MSAHAAGCARPVRRIPKAIGRRALEWMRSYPCVPVRRAMSQGKAQWVEQLPRRFRDRLDLNGGVVEPLRIEIGGGRFPTPGYVHVDVDRRALHLEYVAPAWKLPFVDHAAAEILAVHVLEHVHPGRVGTTLREWYRVLKPHGVLQVHVPNAPEIVNAFGSVTPSEKWALVAAFFGMYRDATVSSPDELDPRRDLPDHQAMYDLDLLRDVLFRAGFSTVEDVTDEVVDRHTLGWAALVPRLSLVVRARKQTGASRPLDPAAVKAVGR